MRLWTLHPMYLDPKGLVAVWREGLLAQAVLQGRTRGYRSHPQLTRFKQQAQPAAAIAAYLREVWLEADRRGYTFDARKIPAASLEERIPETEGQLLYEWQLLRARLENRCPPLYARLEGTDHPEPHPIFTIVPGGVREWERIKPAGPF